MQGIWVPSLVEEQRCHMLRVSLASEQLLSPCTATRGSEHRNEKILPVATKTQTNKHFKKKKKEEES